MSSEEKDLGQNLNRQKRVPLASADGILTERSSTEHVTGRRRRVRISSSEAEKGVQLGSLATRRFANRYPDRSGHREEYSSSSQPRREETHAEPSQRQRTEYAERYHTQRAEGNFDYSYNRNERPRPTAEGKDKEKNTSAKPKKKKHFPLPPEPVKYREILSPDTEIRLNKFLANSGVCSRREADELIQRGEIVVNGNVVTELGSRVTPSDIVEYQGKRVETESKVYVLLNKPKNCVTTSDDPECRLTVMDLVKNACPERIYPVGRLDRHTTGVLLITNDGDLASKLTHPSFMKKKIYHVWLDKPVAMEDMQRIADGIELEDGEIHADALSYVKDDDFTQVGIEIHSGRNRIVRRIFEHLGYKVIKLDRVYFAGLTKKNLPRGRWRYLNEQEVNNLRMGAFE